MGLIGLQSALGRGAPLVTIVVRFRSDVDPVAATERINKTYEDFDLFPQPWYDDPQSRVGSATKESLARLFEWHLKRVPLERYDEASNTWGHWPNLFRWEEVDAPNLAHCELGSLIESIGMSQPGPDDNGQWWE